MGKEWKRHAQGPQKFMKVLGIDPGYDRVGWAVLDRDKQRSTLIACGAITTDKKQVLSKRLVAISSELRQLIKDYSPESASIESLFFATNAKTAIHVAEARGVIVLTCEEARLPISEFTPLQVKSAVTGSGHADKKAVEKMVRLIIKDVPPKLLDDTLDAIAIALV